MKDHVFLISGETLESVTDETVAATVRDLKELNLYHLPYNERCSIRVPGHKMVLRVEKEKRQLFEDRTPQWKARKIFDWVKPPANNDPFPGFDCLRLCEGTEIEVCLYEPPLFKIWLHGQLIGSQRMHDADAEHSKALLITLLATRNAVKTTKENKLKRLGIGKKNASRPDYVTTISVPHSRDLEDDDTVVEGAAKRPHLRRGHIRNQRHGPKMVFIKRIWIEPVFVNADADFVDQRDHYNLAL